jgi:hypothetical protein
VRVQNYTRPNRQDHIHQGDPANPPPLVDDRAIIRVPPQLIEPLGVRAEPCNDHLLKVEHLVIKDTQEQHSVLGVHAFESLHHFFLNLFVGLIFTRKRGVKCGETHF